MKISLLSVVLCLATFSAAHAEKNFEIKNDVFYEQISVPVSEINAQKTSEQGDIILSTQLTFNEKGYLKQYVANDGVVMTTEPYDGYKRKISYAAGETKLQINTEWLDQNVLHHTDGDMQILVRMDENGEIISEKIFFEDEPELTEMTYYQYLKEGEQKPQKLVNDLKAGEKLIFVTTLETDEKGNWIKRQEEEQGGAIQLETRTIKYLENPQAYMITTLQE